MSDYKITCCSTVDLPPDYFVRRDVPLAYFHYEIDGKEYADDMGKTIPIQEFYERIAAGAMPVTSQVNVESYIDMFEPILAAGQDIIHLTLSSGISGSYSSAVIAKSELDAKYPGRKLYVIDSLAASSGYGLLLDAALDMRDSGAAVDDVYKWIEENKLNLHHWFFSSDLRHLKRGGRISATAAAFGTFLNICPLMNVDSTGHLMPRSKVRGKKNVITEMFRRMQQHAQNGAGYTGRVFMSQSACKADAQAVAELIGGAFPKMDGEVLINDIGSVIGAHTGPGTVALFFWGDKRTD
jgi:DegV family protein with EDD domain